MKSWPKVELGQIQVGSNIAQNDSSSPYEVISGHYLPQFTWKVEIRSSFYLLQFGFIYTYLAI